ncbi:MAG: hypothetical protein J6B64_03980 [Bacilli bacterium]|nr:hypothetical protein [Bacilli bacterium]MBP3635451.1 hypothetical protein [Bacilli bacterium]
MSSNKQILKLENNREYFKLQEINHGGINYFLIMNVDNESDIKIVKKILIDDEDYIIDIEDEKLLTELKSKFKSMVDEDKEIFK